jgi:hypothetical protein
MLSPVETGVHHADSMGPTWNIWQGYWVEIRSHYTVNATETSMRTMMYALMVGGGGQLDSTGVLRDICRKLYTGIGTSMER